MKIQPMNFIKNTGAKTIEACGNAKKSVKKGYNAVKGFAKTQSDKFINTKAVKTAKTFLGNNKELIVGSTVLVAGATLAVACVKTIVDKIKEVKEK